MAGSEWKPLSEEEATRRADEEYLAKERIGGWSAWNGKGVPPWWNAGHQWVETVVRAFADRVLTTEHRFDDSLRGRLLGESRKQAGVIYDRKIWHYDAAIPDRQKRQEFVDWTARKIGPTLAVMDQEVMICLGPDGNEAALKEISNGTDRRMAIDAFMLRLSEAGRKITRKDIWTAAGYTDATEFQRFQRGDTRTTQSAVVAFNRVLSMKPEDFIRLLDKLATK